MANRYKVLRSTTSFIARFRALDATKGDNSGFIGLAASFQVAVPTTALTFANASTGGFLAASTSYDFTYTFISPTGETTPIATQTFTTPASGTSTNAITITFPALVAGATGINFYCGAHSGTLYFNTYINTTSVTIGFLPTSGAIPPASNTAYNNNLVAYYLVDSATTGVPVTLSTSTAGTWASGGLVCPDTTNAPDEYEVGVPNALLSASGTQGRLILQGAQGMQAVELVFDIVSINEQDGVRAGLTSLPTVAPGVTNGLALGTFGLHKNVAYNNFAFIMTDSTLHQPASGLTVTSTISRDGGAFGATTNSVSGGTNGVYFLNLSAADVNGNTVVLNFQATGADTLPIVLFMQT